MADTQEIQAEVNNHKQLSRPYLTHQVKSGDFPRDIWSNVMAFAGRICPSELLMGQKGLVQVKRAFQVGYWWLGTEIPRVSSTVHDKLKR